MKTRIESIKKKWILLAIVISVLLGSLLFYVVGFWRSIESDDPLQRTAFSLDTSKVSGWWAGENTWQSEEGNGEDQQSEQGSPVVSMTVAQGSSDSPGACFVMFFYWKGAADTKTLLDEMKTRTIEGNKALSLAEISVHQLNFLTLEGDKGYAIHQYEVKGSSRDSITRGVEFGYVVLSGGYIEVRGYCEAVAQLPATIPALGAVSFKR